MALIGDEALSPYSHSSPLSVCSFSFRCYRLKTLTGLILICIISFSVIGVVAVSQPMLFSGLTQNDILGVSSVLYEANGVAGADGAVHGSNWKVLATTGNANMYFLQLNQSYINSLGVKASYPDDIQITGSVTFGAFQTYSPYWYVPVEKIPNGDITVYPQMTGSYKGSMTSSYTVPAMTVSVWQTKPSSMQLFIPFSIGILKTLGSDLGSFVTSYEGAAIQHSEQGDYYTFSISAESIASGEMSKTIVFMNPADSSETVTINLQFSVGSAYQFPSEPWIIVTERNGGEVNNNVFHYSDLQTILNTLDYTRGSEWSYYHYLYGGGGVFKGTGYASWGSGSVAFSVPMPPSTWSDGSVCPQFYAAVPTYPTLTYVFAEGFKYPTYNVVETYEFPGWYVPSPENNEGVRLGGDYWNYRLPLAGSLRNDLVNTRPTTKSIVNYLCDSLNVGGIVKPFTLQRITMDYWGYGAQGSCPLGIGVMIPNGARQWLITASVSSDVVDTVVEVDNFIHVSIANPSLDVSLIGQGQTATFSCNLVNHDNFAGRVSVGVSVPASLSYGVTSFGGTGSMRFEAAGQTGSTRQFSFSLTNLGNFREDKTETLTLKITNDAGEVTDSENFQVTFKKGLGVEDTLVVVTTQDADSNALISGLTVQVYYGQGLTDSVSPMTTQEGSATFDLNVYTGYAKIVVSDNGGRYEQQAKTVGPLDHGANQATFKMVAIGSSVDFPWLLVLAVVAVVSAIGLVVFKAKRR